MFYNKCNFIYLRTKHQYHLVDPSPLPISKSLGGFRVTVSRALYNHKNMSVIYSNRPAVLLHKSLVKLLATGYMQKLLLNTASCYRDDLVKIIKFRGNESSFLKFIYNTLEFKYNCYISKAEFFKRKFVALTTNIAYIGPKYLALVPTTLRPPVSPSMLNDFGRELFGNSHVFFISGGTPLNFFNFSMYPNIKFFVFNIGDSLVANCHRLASVGVFYLSPLFHEVFFTVELNYLLEIIRQQVDEIFKLKQENKKLNVRNAIRELNIGQRVVNKFYKIHGNGPLGKIFKLTAGGGLSTPVFFTIDQPELKTFLDNNPQMGYFNLTLPYNNKLILNNYVILNCWFYYNLKKELDAKNTLRVTETSVKFKE